MCSCDRQFCIIFRTGNERSSKPKKCVSVWWQGAALQNITKVPGATTFLLSYICRPPPVLNRIPTNKFSVRFFFLVSFLFWTPKKLSISMYRQLDVSPLSTLHLTTCPLSFFTPQNTTHLCVLCTKVLESGQKQNALVCRKKKSLEVLSQLSSHLMVICFFITGTRSCLLEGWFHFSSSVTI